MLHLRGTRRSCGFGIGALAILVAAVSMFPATSGIAATISSDFLVRVDVSQDVDGWGTQTGQYLVSIPAGTPITGNYYSWSLPSSQEIVSQDNLVLMRLDSLTVRFYADASPLYQPGVSLGFGGELGEYGAHVTITSGTVSFNPYSSPEGFATCGVTLTDNNSDEGTMMPFPPAPKIYQAKFNSPAVVWANLLGTVTAPLDDSSGQQSDRRPGTGFEAIGSPVSSMSSQYDFLATPLDGISGTSSFRIVPEPATLALLAFGGLSMRIVRRRGR